MLEGRELQSNRAHVLFCISPYSPATCALKLENILYKKFHFPFSILNKYNKFRFVMVNNF